MYQSINHVCEGILEYITGEAMAFCLGASWTSVKGIPKGSTRCYAAEVFRGLDFQHDHYLLHHLDL